MRVEYHISTFVGLSFLSCILSLMQNLSQKSRESRKWYTFRVNNKPTRRTAPLSS